MSTIQPALQAPDALANPFAGSATTGHGIWRTGVAAAVAWAAFGLLTWRWPNHVIGFSDWAFTTELGIAALRELTENLSISQVSREVNRLAQQLAVQFVTDRRDVAALLGAEDVAGAADFQVAHGDLKARSQLRKLLDCLQPPRRRRRNLLVRVEQ